MQDANQSISSPTATAPAKSSRWTTVGKWTLWITGLLLVSYLWMLPPEPEFDQRDKNSTLQVTTLSVTPSSKTLPVLAQGVTQARWQQAVSANITGRVKVLSNALITGGFVQKGELLLQMEDTTYRAEYASATAALAQAELNLARYQHEQTVAKKVTQQKNLSAFGRFEPHIKAAHAEVNAAKARLALAEQQLKDTQQTAPFNAVILNKQVSPQQWVNQGDALYTLAASTAVDVEVALPLMQWQKLNNANPLSATIIGVGNTQWQASVRFTSPMLDSTTRQRSITLTVENPYQQVQLLLPNQVVKVKLAGKQQHHTINVPASVLTEDGEVWTVRNQTLHKENVEILQQTLHQVTFRFTERPEAPRELVRFPLSSMLEGQRVTTMQAPEQETTTSKPTAQQPFVYSQADTNPSASQDAQALNTHSGSKH